MNYFLIPITAIINTDLNFEDILKCNYEDVYKAAIDFNINEDDYHLNILFNLLVTYNLPYYLILKKDNNRLFEIESNTEICTIGINLMDYEIKEDNLKYYIDDNYLNTIINLFYGTTKKF